MAPLSANVNVLSAIPRLLVPRWRHIGAAESTLQKAESGAVNLPGPQLM